jgi:hypothetical protein
MHDQQTLPMQLSTMRAYVKRRSAQVILKVEEISSAPRAGRAVKSCSALRGAEKSIPSWSDASTTEGGR